MARSLLRDELLDPKLMEGSSKEKKKKKRRGRSVESKGSRRGGFTNFFIDDNIVKARRRHRSSVSPVRSSLSDLFDDRSTRGSVKSSKSERKTERVARKLDKFQKLHYAKDGLGSSQRDGSKSIRRRRSLGDLRDTLTSTIKTRSSDAPSRRGSTGKSSSKKNKNRNLDRSLSSSRVLHNQTRNSNNNNRALSDLDAYLSNQNAKTSRNSYCLDDTTSVHSSATMSFRGFSGAASATRSSRRRGNSVESRSVISAPTATTTSKKRRGSVDPTRSRRSSSRLEKINSARNTQSHVMDGETPPIPSSDRFGTVPMAPSGRGKNRRSSRILVASAMDLNTGAGTKTDESTMTSDGRSDSRKSSATSVTENTSTGSLSTGCSFEDDNLFPLISPRRIVVEKENKDDMITTYILVDNKDGTMKERRGRYMGPLNKNNQPHTTMGTIQFENGDIYKGPFENGAMHGDLGHFLYKDGDEYTGGFRHNLRHGQGVYLTVNSRQYIGKFRHDKPNGHGVLYNADGSVFFEGKWKDGAPQHREHKRRSTSSSIGASSFPCSPEAEEENWENLGRRVIEQLVAEGI